MLKKTFIILITLSLYNCSVIHLNLDSEKICNCEKKLYSCEECKVIPSSGTLRDLRRGAYYDPIEEKCVEITYSSGGVPAPFQNIRECESCCCNSTKNTIILSH